MNGKWLSGDEIKNLKMEYARVFYRLLPTMIEGDEGSAEWAERVKTAIATGEPLEE